jgi:hypothetical protein
MTLYRGTAQISGTHVLILPPQGFGAINGLRLTNYTGMTLLLNNMASTGQGEEFLFPQQQMVYHTRNISAPPEAQGYYTHKAFSPNQLFVEWSDDSINDFIGVYPAFLPQPTLASAVFLGSPVILTVNSPVTIAAPPPINEGVLTATVNSVQTPGPLTIPTGFEFDLTGLQITATYGGPIGVAQFTIDLGAMTGAVITNIWAQTSFVLQKTALADNPTSTQILTFPQGSVVIPAGAIPIYIYDTGPAGVTFSATATGVLLPTS